MPRAAYPPSPVVCSRDGLPLGTCFALSLAVAAPYPIATAELTLGRAQRVDAGDAACELDSPIPEPLYLKRWTAVPR